MATLLKNFRNYSETEVNNLFSYSGSYPVSRGTPVKLGGSGYVIGQSVVGLAGAVGYQNLHGLSERWAIPSYVTATNAVGDKVAGILLYDGKEVDENGNRLIFNKQKQGELNCFISGENAPIVKRGSFFYSGITGAQNVGGPLYLAGNGDGFTTAAGGAQVGKIMGAITNGAALIELDIA